MTSNPIEIASSPLILISGKIRNLLQSNLGLDLPESLPLTRGPVIRQLLQNLSESGYQAQVSGFQQLPEKCCQLFHPGTGCRIEVWGRSTAEAVLRAAALVALQHQTNLAVA